MELAYAIPADAAEVGPTGKISMLGGDFENIVVSEFPSLHTRLALVVKLLVRPSECDQEHLFRAMVVGPEGTATNPVLLAPFTPRKVLGNEERIVRYFLVLNFPVLVFFGSGDHDIRLLVDDSEVGHVPFRVVQGSAASSQSSSNDVPQVWQ